MGALARAGELQNGVMELGSQCPECQQFAIVPISVPEGGLLGSNPRAGGGRVNTDLPGGRATAKSIFRAETEGEVVTQGVMKNGGTIRMTESGKAIRFNPDGTTRVDLPRGPTGRETIHLDP